VLYINCFESAFAMLHFRLNIRLFITLTNALSKQIVLLKSDFAAGFSFSVTD
jgi:hypothetical protein